MSVVIDVPQNCEVLREIALRDKQTMERYCEKLRKQIKQYREEIGDKLVSYKTLCRVYFLSLLRERNEYWCGHCNRTHSQETEPPQVMLHMGKDCFFYVCPSCITEIAGKKNWIKSPLDGVSIQQAPKEFTNELIHKYGIPPTLGLIGELTCTLEVEEVVDSH